jgi:hypothetical protein
MAAVPTTFSPRSPERLIRGRGFTLVDVSTPSAPLILGLVKQFELSFGTEVSRFTTLDGDQGIVERPPMGQLSCARLASTAGLPKLVCDCVLKTLQLTAGIDSCSHPVDTQYLLKNAKFTNIAVSGNADDWIVNYQVMITFTDLT